MSLEDGRLDGKVRDGARLVVAEVLSASAEGRESVRGDGDETGVLAGGGRHEDIVIGLTPIERRSR